MRIPISNPTWHRRPSLRREFRMFSGSRTAPSTQIQFCDMEQRERRKKKKKKNVTSNILTCRQKTADDSFPIVLETGLISNGDHCCCPFTPNITLCFKRRWLQALPPKLHLTMRHGWGCATKRHCSQAGSVSWVRICAREGVLFFWMTCYSCCRTSATAKLAIIGIQSVGVMSDVEQRKMSGWSWWRRNEWRVL